MKKIITTLLMSSTLINYSQEAVQHYYYGTNETLGAEMYFQVRNTESSFLGGGFSGTLKNKNTQGRWDGGDITEEEIIEFSTGTSKEQWFSLYVIGSLGYVGKVLITGNLGVGMYGQMMNFKKENDIYHKNDILIFDPIIGANGQYQITRDLGVIIGYDTFNGVKVGISIIFE